MKADATNPKPAGMGKRFAALARVSSREQEREGWSLEVQEEALHRYAEKQGGSIVKLFKIAETASKKDERKTFKELLAYAKANAGKIDGLLFYKVDRAARNLFDYVELERLESECNIPFISISQPTDNTPAGHMMRRTMATMAAFFTEQQSIDVREGHARRVRAGLFCNRGPYGYRNVRINGRSIVEVDELKAKNVRLIYDLYAYQNHTLDMIVQRLARDGIAYTEATPIWPRSKVHKILRDRAYIGEVGYKGQWHPGTHKPIVNRTTWDRVQVLLGDKIYQSHELTYAGELIRCAHCGAFITGESVIKKKSGKEYVYYRCVKYTSDGHPRVRIPEAQLDKQVLAMFARLKLAPEKARWFAGMMRRWCQDQQKESRVRTEDIQRELTSLRQQQDRLLNLRLLEEIEADTYARKNTELRDRIAALIVQMEAADRGRDELADLAQKAFELSQSLREMWFRFDNAKRRELLKFVCLNSKLDGATLVAEMNKPFAMLAEGLSVSSSRGCGIRTRDLQTPSLTR